MRLVFLGTGGFHANERRQTTALMVPELGLVLDAGSGLFRLSDYLQTDTLDIYLSHAHLDHVVGLTYLIEMFGTQAHDRLTLHAAPQVLAAVHDHLFAEQLFPVPPPFACRELPATTTVAGGGKLTTFPLVHPGGSLGMRIDWTAGSLAYVTDTTAAADSAYIEHIRGVDVLVHEANFPPGYDELAVRTGHSCLDHVAQVAAAARVGQLVLIHSDPLLARHNDFDLTAACRVFAATHWACDGQSLDLF